MSEDPLLRDLAQFARDERDDEQRRLDERWEALAAGTLSDEEDAELRELAADSPELAAAYEAFEPLDPAFADRMTEAVRFGLKGQRQPPATEPSPAEARPGRPQAHPRFLRRWTPVAGLIAAGILLLLWPSPSAPPLPAYDLELRGAVQTTRSEPDSEPAAGTPYPMRRGNRLNLVLTPAEPVTGEVVARVFTSHQGRITPLASPLPRLSAAGAVRFEGEIGADLELPNGEVELVIVVGREQHLPTADELLASGGDDRLHHAAWSAWHIPLRIEE